MAAQKKARARSASERARKGWQTRRARERARARRAAAARKGWETRRRAAERRRRSIAAKKGWETRRRRKQREERKRRSAAAKKGWETRRKRQAAASKTAREAVREGDYDEEDVESAKMYGVHPADVESLRETLDVSAWADPAADAWSHDKLISYIEELAEAAGIDEGDIWDLWWQLMYSDDEAA